MACVCAERPALADPQSLGANLPIRVKDAFNSSNFGDLELYFTERGTEDPQGRYSLRGGPKIKLGLLPGLAVDLLPANQFGTAKTIHGGLAVTALEYQLNEQTDRLPTFLIEGVYDAPYSGPLGSSEYHLIGVATKSLGNSIESPRVDLELTYAHVTAPESGERNDRWSIGVAYSHLLSSRVALVADYVHDTQRSVGKYGNFADLGLNVEIDSHIQMGIGAGIGIVQRSFEPRGFFGVKWKP